jgi:urea transporter
MSYTGKYAAVFILGVLFCSVLNIGLHVVLEAIGVSDYTNGFISAYIVLAVMVLLYYKFLPEKE